MRKLLNLYRLNFKNAVKMPAHWVKHTFKLGFSPEESTLNEYYVQLIHNDGFLKSENETSYSSFFPKWSAHIKTRKQPADDLAVFRKVFCMEELKPLADAFSHYGNTGKKLDIIDADSHVGLAVLYLSRLFPNARFICMEADKENFDVLGFNLAENVAKSEKLLGRLRQNASDAEGQFAMQQIIARYNLETIDILKMHIDMTGVAVFTADAAFLTKTRCVALTFADDSYGQAVCRVLKQYGFTYFNSEKWTIGINQKLV